jgi:hypothetical protein
VCFYTPYVMIRNLRFLAWTTWLLAGAVFAQGPIWEGRLQDGGRLTVDPTTRRATVVTPHGLSSQLWDGVHRLEDGSTVTVHSGIIVPNRQMVEPSLPMPVVAEGPSPCLVLLRKTCGLHDECKEQESCGHAAQLVQIERDEQLEYKGSTLTGTGQAVTPRQCEQALGDQEIFKACSRPQRGSVATPCERLVDKVCGRNGRCDARPACGPARQLLETEYEERAASLYPDALTASSGQCSQALQDKEFFLTCEQ